MNESPKPSEEEKDWLAEWDQRLAAEVRQLLRAHRARDAKALEVGWGYFQWSLPKQLRRLLQVRDSVWDGSRRWFDGFTADPEYPAPGRLRLCGELCWVSGQEHWYYDPFEFEMELCPQTGTLRRYVFRFGDSRPLTAKVSGSATSGVPVGGWAFEIERCPANPGAAPNPASE